MWFELLLLSLLTFNKPWIDILVHIRYVKIFVKIWILASHFIRKFWNPQNVSCNVRQPNINKRCFLYFVQGRVKKCTWTQNRLLWNKVPRLSCSRGKQINPSSPQLIKADAPSVRASGVAPSATQGMRRFFIALALSSAQTKCSTIFFARPFPTSIINTALQSASERESECIFWCAREEYIYSEQKLWPLSRLFICRWGFKSLGLCPNHESRKLLISTTNGKVANNTLTIAALTRRAHRLFF